MTYNFFCWLCSALYRGVVPGITGSMVTGATYFGFIESTKDWLKNERPNVANPWAHFCAGAIGTALKHCTLLCSLFGGFISTWYKFLMLLCKYDDRAFA